MIKPSKSLPFADLQRSNLFPFCRGVPRRWFFDFASPRFYIVKAFKTSTSQCLHVFAGLIFGTKVPQSLPNPISARPWHTRNLHLLTIGVILPYTKRQMLEQLEIWRALAEVESPLAFSQLIEKFHDLWFRGEARAQCFLRIFHQNYWGHHTNVTDLSNINNATSTKFWG